MRGNTYIFNLVSLFFFMPRRRGGGALSDAAISLSVCLSHLGQLGAQRHGPARPPGLCGLRIRLRTDVDPPRSAEAYRLAARQLVFLCIFIMFTTCQVVLLTVHTDRRDCARTELSMLCGMLVTAAGS